MSKQAMQTAQHGMGGGLALTVLALSLAPALAVAPSAQRSVPRKALHTPVKDGEEIWKIETYARQCKYVKVGDVEQTLKAILGDSRGHITLDERDNMVRVTGPADIIALSKAVVQKLDVALANDPRLIIDFDFVSPIRTYTVPGGNAEVIAKNLQEIYKGSSVRIAAVDNTWIMVYAEPEDRIKIARQILFRSVLYSVLFPRGPILEAYRRFCGPAVKTQ